MKREIGESRRFCRELFSEGENKLLDYLTKVLKYF